MVVVVQKTIRGGLAGAVTGPAIKEAANHPNHVSVSCGGRKGTNFRAKNGIQNFESKWVVCQINERGRDREP